MTLRSSRGCAMLLVALTTVSCFTATSFAGFVLSTDVRNILGEVEADDGGNDGDFDARNAPFGTDWSDAFTLNAGAGSSAAESTVSQNSTIDTLEFTGTGSGDLSVETITGTASALTENNMLLQFGVDQTYDFELDTFMASYGDGVDAFSITLKEDATTLFSTTSSGVDGTTGTFTTGHTYTLQVISRVFRAAGSEKAITTGINWDVTLTIPEPATCGLLLLVCGLIRRR